MVLFRITPLCLFLAILFGLSLFSPIDVYSIDNFTEEIELIRGDIESLPAEGLKRISVSDPSVADVHNVEASSATIIAKGPGQTLVYLWDKHGKQTFLVRVAAEDLYLLKERLDRLLAEGGYDSVRVRQNPYEGVVTLTGELPADQRGGFEELIAPFGQSIKDLVKEEGANDLVEVDVRIYELNSSYEQELGFEWNKSIGVAETSGASGEAFEVARDLNDVARITTVSRIPVFAKLNAFVEEGKGKILSKPKLVVTSGKEANFLVGGEVPVVTTIAFDNNRTQENVEYREFGVKLNIVPTIKGGNIDLSMRIEVSDVDSSTSITDAGSGDFLVAPGFTERSAETHLVLEDGQTIVLAGMIQTKENEIERKVPFLGDIPLFGKLLFRKKTQPSAGNTETELLIAMTPRIIRGNKPVKKTYVPGRKRKLPPLPKGSSTHRPMDIKIQKKAAPRPQTISYPRLVQEKIANAIIYPDEAREFGMEGSVTLDLKILFDGTLAYAGVKESSGQDVFDRDALQTAKRAAPFSAFPAGEDLQEYNIIVPIVYSLND